MLLHLQATVVELEAVQQQLKAQLTDAADRHDAAQRAAAEARHAAAELLSKTQARTSCFARVCIPCHSDDVPNVTSA